MVAPVDRDRRCRHSEIYLLGDNLQFNVTDSHEQWLKFAKDFGTPYNFGLGGGSSRAVTGSVKPVRAWAPSQNGLLAD